MQVNTRREREADIISVQGDIDLDNSSQLRKVLLDRVSASERVVVDLSGVPYMDSSGIACLVEAYQKARAKGSGFVLAQVGNTVLSTLKLAKLNKVFTITESLQEAIGGG